MPPAKSNAGDNETRRNGAALTCRHGLPIIDGTNQGVSYKLDTLDTVLTANCSRTHQKIEVNFFFSYRCRHPGCCFLQHTNIPLDHGVGRLFDPDGLLRSKCQNFRVYLRANSIDPEQQLPQLGRGERGLKRTASTDKMHGANSALAQSFQCVIGDNRFSTNDRDRLREREPYRLRHSRAQR